MQAKSLLPVLDGKPVRDSVFIQYDHQHPSPGSDNVPPRVHTLIDGRYRLSVFHGTGWGELYDLENDPGEFDNLWDVPAHAATRARMMEKLAARRDRARRPRAAADAAGVTIAPTSSLPRSSDEKPAAFTIRRPARESAS